MDGDQVLQFMEVTGCTDRARAQYFVASAGGSLDVRYRCGELGVGFFFK